MWRNKVTTVFCMRFNTSGCLHQTSQLGRRTPHSLQNVHYVSTKRTISHRINAFSSMKWFLLLIPATTFGLGTWQVQRLKWKRQLIADLKERTSASPVDLPHNLDDLSQLEYCPVRVEGQFDHSRELYIGPRILLVHGDAVVFGGVGTQKSGVQSGYQVVTPFQLADRDMTILVNRGWVPANWKDPNTRKEGQVEKEVEIVGIVRLNEKRAPFIPKNEPNIWFYRDLPKMAEVAGTEPIFLEAIAETTVPGGPIGGQTRMSLRNEHLSYMLTWYGLSATTAYMWCRRFIARKPLL